MKEHHISLLLEKKMWKHKKFLYVAVSMEKKDNKNEEVGWITITSTLKGTSYPVTKLIEGKEYIFRVSAENRFGCGPTCVSEPAVAKNQFGKS